MRKRVLLLLAAIFFISTLIAVAHHHDDECDHHDCPVCQVLYHAKTTEITLIDIDLAPKFTEIEYIVQEPNSSLPVWQIGPLEIRPPPA